MFIPPGFGQRSVITKLGRMVYYTAEATPWADTISDAVSNSSGSFPDASPETPTLAFLHGFGGGSSAYEWSRVYPAFAAEYRIVAPDLIGWGRSDHPAFDYRPEDYIMTIVDFIEQTCQGPTTVIASGLTAAFTVRAAIVRPDLFKSLILTTAAGLEEFGKSYRQSFAAQGVKLPGLDRFFYAAGVATGFGIRSFLEQRQFAHADRIDTEMVEAYLQSAQQPRAEYAALAFVRGDLCFDLSQYIKQLTVPTAIIWGRESEYTSPEIGRRLAALNPEFIRSFYHLNEVGFTPQLELPAVTIGLIRKFLPLLESS